MLDLKRIDLERWRRRPTLYVKLLRHRSRWSTVKYMTPYPHDDRYSNEGDVELVQMWCCYRRRKQVSYGSTESHKGFHWTLVYKLFWTPEVRILINQKLIAMHVEIFPDIQRLYDIEWSIIAVLLVISHGNCRYYSLTASNNNVYLLETIRILVMFRISFS